MTNIPRRHVFFRRVASVFKGRGRQACAPKLLGALCYIVPGTSFGERNGQHERTARE